MSATFIHWLMVSLLGLGLNQEAFVWAYVSVATAYLAWSAGVFAFVLLNRDMPWGQAAVEHVRTSSLTVWLDSIGYAVLACFAYLGGHVLLAAFAALYWLTTGLWMAWHLRKPA